MSKDPAFDAALADMEKQGNEEAAYQSGAGTPPSTDQPISIPHAARDVPKTNRKRKQPTDGAESKKQQNKPPPENRAIYVSGLPTDITLSEIDEFFTRFGGMIQEGEDGKKRIYLYTDEKGDPRGDATIVYFRPESVGQAISLLDDTEFRYRSGKMTVQEADMNYKKQKTVDEGEKPKYAGAAKAARQKKFLEQQRRLTEWSSDEEPANLPTLPPNRWNKVVILKHVFDPKEIEEDPACILDIKEDIRDDAEKFGDVTNVVLYDQEPDAVMTVRFKDPEDAEKYVARCNGRKFDGNVVEASIAQHRPRFRKLVGEAEKEARRAYFEDTSEDGSSNDED